MAVTHASIPAAMERALALFAPGRRPEQPPMVDGYLDLLGERSANGTSAAQRLMMVRWLPAIYERIYRPLGLRVVLGFKAPRQRDELRLLAGELLQLSHGDCVLDVGCGPGNFSKGFSEATGDGLVVGFDAAGTMLAFAARKRRRDNVAYIRGDACELPFSDGSFDAICYYGVLHLLEDPMKALDEVVRVLVPGGRVAIQATYDRGGRSARGLGGLPMFGREYVTGALGERGMVDVQQSIESVIQVVSARKPPAATA